MSRTILKTGLLCLMLVAGYVSVNAQQTEQQHFEMSKNLDIFNSVFKELNLFYVDSIDQSRMIQTGIRSMTKTLDPYTEYIPEDKMKDFKFLTTGEYAGIGAMITSRDGQIIVVDPYEDMPAALNGLQAGDRILEIDGESLDGKDSNYASERLRGQPNTKLKIKYQRLDAKKPTIVEIERKQLHVNPVTYYGVLQNNTGYIYLSDFTLQCFQDVKAAFDDLKTNHHITSLIIDLRNNGGGVMEDALQILNMFVPKGKVLLTMKGKSKQSDRISRATQNPIDADIPLVVLVNQSSASASEIVAGSLQDLDRAVIVGRRTYGKGLVQTPRDLPYNGQLKVTTAKYYIPSGRCVQAIDYTHRDKEGDAGRIPDSLTTVFYTEKGRPVRDGGGVTPDFVVEEKKVPNIIYYMDMDYIFFDFANQWRQKHSTIASPSEFTLKDEDYESFKTFVKGEKFEYDRQSEKVMESLKEMMEFEGYLDAASTEFAALENKLKPDLDRDLELYKSQLSEYLSRTIMKQRYYAKGELIYTLKSDNDLNKALEILKDNQLYEKTLNVKVSTDLK